ncbi:glycosyltransferase [Algibacter lectus]|uniref:Glycosyltransferase n=1 Tax=Algibacter lectus TaxID=221126 RepID=A0A090VK06_9FLAO|nr:glycosyltransferase [Algibacter lectus]GAL64383.1 glycosyltransferase [Algibacter lectus]
MINYIFRSPLSGRNSIEELFKTLIPKVTVLNKTGTFFLSHPRATIVSMLKNTLAIRKLSGIIHITGDVHYLALLPFKKTVLTIHDVEFLKGNILKQFFLALFWFWLPSLFVKRITVISEFSKKQVLAIIPWAKRKTTVIYNPVNPILKKQPRECMSEIPQILHIGTSENKNLINTIKGLKNIPSTLHIVGNLTQEHKEALRTNEISFKNYVDIPFSKIQELYESSDIVSFISLFEGFGMPIIEAQQVGRVVITSNKGAIPEIASNAVHYVNPLDCNEIHNGFLKLINDKDYRLSLINKGYQNIERFNLDYISNQYMAVYNEL